MLLTDATAAYVTDRQARGEIGARTARQLAWRLHGLAICHPGLDVADLDRDHVLAWQRTIGWQKPASRRAYLSTLRVFCAWAVDADLLAADPTGRLGRVREPHGVPRALSAGQMARLLMILPDERAQLIVLLMRQCGLRCVEVARLAGVDYDPGASMIHVVGKAGSSRDLPVLDNLAVLLDRRAATVGRGPVVGLTAGAISRLVSTWMDQAGLKTGPRDGVSAHALRHTAASNMLDRWKNVRTVQEFLGHVSLATTERYLRRASTAEIRAAMVASA